MNNRFLDVAFQISMATIVFSLALMLLGLWILVLMHICVVWKALRNLRDTAGNLGCVGEDRGLSNDDLDSIPCYHFVGKENAVDCAVCLERFNAGDRCRLLPLCKHSFHAQCVDLWLRKNSICPICRTDAISGSKRLNLKEEERHFRAEIGSDPRPLSSYFV